MERWRKALLLVGLLNLVLLGAVACGNKAEDVASSELTARVIRLEAWRLAQERMTLEHRSALESQQALNSSFESYMQMARDHDVSVDKSLTKQAEAMRLMNAVLQDVLAKLK